VTLASVSTSRSACRRDTPLVADRPIAYRDYRQRRDNPPQFYGMLSHEVFAPHRQLHALRLLNSPALRQ
jgi:hypothetical protein